MPLQPRNKANQKLLLRCLRVSRTGDLKNAETFISAGVDPNLPDQYGRTPLYYAALFNRNEMAALLLAHKADPNTPASGPTSGSEFAQIPLQIATSMGNLRMASMLVDAGAQVNAKTKAGRVALHFAAIGSHLDLIRFLIERGAGTCMTPQCLRMVSALIVERSATRPLAFRTHSPFRLERNAIRDAIIDSVANPLLAAKISLDRLHRHVSK